MSPAELRGDPEIARVTLDSRQAGPNALFVCMPSKNADAHQFIADARARGAAAAMVFRAEALDGPGLYVPEEDGAFREAVWRICREVYGHPTRTMQTIGVTGTNGKTTTAWLMRDLLRSFGRHAAYLGTLGIQMPGEERELNNTTPFAVELYGLLDEMRSKGVDALSMEVSSHALAERRADGVEFDAAVFTNLTQDHLDFHGTMENYEHAKWRLFADLPRQTEKPFVAAFHVGDPVGRRWSAQYSGKQIRFGIDGDDLAADVEEVRVTHIRMALRTPQARTPVFTVPLGAWFNVENSLSAAAGMLALGYPLEQIGEALPHVHPVPGRFEAVPNELGIGVLVDYAHTPDALEKLLESVRALQPRRVITVFGCGGDRDRTKRPKMARAASAYSDVTVVTSDNPRTEDPQAILDEVRTGILPGTESVAILDRREAIAAAVSMAQPDDVVVIAGKGHENYQIIGRTKFPMDDRQMAREALENRA